MKKAALLITAIIGVLIALSKCGNSPINVISKDEFNQIKTGMTYEQVKSIIGEDGEVLSESVMPAIPGVMDEVVTVIYMWQNPDGSNCNVTFQNNKVFAKAQALL